MFNRTEINRLRELSLFVLGKESGYQKLLQDPSFKILTGYKETEERVSYVDVPVKKDAKTGRIKYRRERKENVKPYPLVSVPQYRDLTFLEIEGALLGASEMKSFEALVRQDEGVFYETLIHRYNDGTIINKPLLVVSEADKEEYDSLFALLPDLQKDVISKYVVSAPKQGAFSVSGNKFVAELVYQNKHKEEPQEVPVS